MSVYNIDYYKVLTECGISVDWAAFETMNEVSQLHVTDDVLTGMLKFISDKYNSLDFKELEKSAGDIAKFKYTGMLKENANTLLKIYEASPDDGASNYTKVCIAILDVIMFLETRRKDISDLYKAGNGIVQLMYTSLLAACIYSLGILVANTIRFVTTEQDTDCQVLYDEIPGTIKNVHIKNVLVAADSIPDFNKIVDHYASMKNSRAMHEAVTLAGIKSALSAAYANGGVSAVAGKIGAAASAFAHAHPIGMGILAAGAIIMLIPKLIVLIREIIYSIYYLRVKMSDMLGVQAELLQTNIESLESGHGDKKVIARQRKVVDVLTKWQNAVAVKIDNNAVAMNSQKKVENQKLKLDRNSPLVKDPGALAAGDLML